MKIKQAKSGLYKVVLSVEQATWLKGKLGRECSIGTPGEGIYFAIRKLLGATKEHSNVPVRLTDKNNVRLDLTKEQLEWVVYILGKPTGNYYTEVTGNKKGVYETLKAFVNGL